jgi:hypothetical protein
MGDLLPRHRAAGEATPGRIRCFPPVASVEIRIASADVGTRMDEVRGWLQARGCSYRFTSTGSSDETVVVVDFPSDADAVAFAQQFSGSLMGG